MTGRRSVNQPLPIDQPTTPQALPLARTSKGKISAGYNHGTVSHVAPNVAVKRKIMATAPELAPRAAGEPTGCWRPIVASPPARNIEIPWTMEPQYSVQRRPILSKVNTQMRVANCILLAQNRMSTYRRTYHIGYGVQAGDPLHLIVRNTRSTEDCWSKNSHTSNTDPFLHDLKPDNKLYAPPSVELARADTKEHGDVRLRFCRLAFELCDVANILEFCFGLAHILAGLTTKATKDITSLIFTPNLNEPTWGLGEHPTDRKEKEQRSNLEGNWEPPGKFTSSPLIEIAATARMISTKCGLKRESSVCSLFDPVGNNNTKDVQGKLNGDELSA